MSTNVFRWPIGVRQGLVTTLVVACCLSAAFAQKKVLQSITGSGGSKAVSANYGVRGTVGQPAIGRMQTVTYGNPAGYWYNPGTTVTGLDNAGDEMPIAHELFQNYPNPFNPTTTIRFALPKPSHVVLDVFDVAGRRVARIVDREMKAGVHDEVFDAGALASGVYFYRIQALDFIEIRKLVVLK